MAPLLQDDRATRSVRRRAGRRRRRSGRSSRAGSSASSDRTVPARRRSSTRSQGSSPHAAESSSTVATSPARPPHRRARAGLGRTWQSVELFDDLTVAENLRRRRLTPTRLGWPARSTWCDRAGAAPRRASRSRSRRRRSRARRPPPEAAVPRPAQAGRRRPRPRAAAALVCSTSRRPGSTPPRAARSASGCARDRRRRDRDAACRPRHGSRARHLRRDLRPRVRRAHRARNAGRGPLGRPRSSPRTSARRHRCASAATTVTRAAARRPRPPRRLRGVPVVRDLSCTSTPAKSSLCSDQTARARRRRSRRCPGCCRRSPARRVLGTPVGRRAAPASPGAGSHSCPRTGRCSPASPSRELGARRAGSATTAARGRVLEYFPALPPLLARRGRPAVGRRAADAGDRPRDRRSSPGCSWSTR